MRLKRVDVVGVVKMTGNICLKHNYLELLSMKKVQDLFLQSRSSPAPSDRTPRMMASVTGNNKLLGYSRHWVTGHIQNSNGEYLKLGAYQVVGGDVLSDKYPT